MTKKQKSLFLESLRVTGNVGISCRYAGVNRREAFEERSRSKAFDKQWEEAAEEAVDFLEAVAWERALSGNESLLKFMLQGARPERYCPGDPDRAVARIAKGLQERSVIFASE